MNKNLFSALFLVFFYNVYSQRKVELFFDSDQDIPNQVSKKVLDDLIKEDPRSTIDKIYGYCDDSNTDLYNIDLGTRRINNVLLTIEKSFTGNNNLILLSELEKKSFGENFEQSKSKSKNRKVVILLSNYQFTKKSGEESLSQKIQFANAGEKIEIRNLNFLNRSAILIQKSKPILSELLQVLVNNPKLKIEIQGHICCQENGDYEDISTQRAKSIYDFLIENKINSNRLSYKGFGTKVPIFKIPEINEFQANANRRVEILILEN